MKKVLIGNCCERCNSSRLVLLRSKNLKICSDCKAEYIWLLDNGQKPLVNTNRGDRTYQNS